MVKRGSGNPILEGYNHLVNETYMSLIVKISIRIPSIWTHSLQPIFCLFVKHDEIWN